MNFLEQCEQYNIHKLADLAGKRVLLRIDVNVSLGENDSVDPGEDWRIIQSLGTIEFLKKAGASVIILSHIGREPHESLKPVFKYMQKFFTMGFIPHYDAAILNETISAMRHGDICMLENVRQFPGETENDISYLNDIIPLCDIYVNDAFSVSHREHASVHAITKHLPSYFGLQFMDEIKHLNDFLSHKDGIKALVLGGAKFETKLTLLEKLLPDLDFVLLGGALANVFLKARGYNIGISFCDNVDISSILDNQKIILPIDYIDQHGDVADIYDVGDNDNILDIGPATTQLFEQIIDNASAIMWNGPLGKYEDGFTESSIQIADSISHSEAFSVTGGGDTSTVILENNLEDNFSFISTGGGAMLDFLVDGSLPGIDIILTQKDN